MVFILKAFNFLLTVLKNHQYFYFIYQNYYHQQILSNIIEGYFPTVNFFFLLVLLFLQET